MFQYLNKKNISVACTFTLILLFVCGCSGETNVIEEKGVYTETEDENIIAISTVLEKEFTGHDKTYKQLSENIWNKRDKDGYESTVKEVEELELYAEETYKLFFTENGFTNFLNTVPAFFYQSFDGDYSLSMDNLEIKQEKEHPTIYRFTFTVILESSDGSITSYDFKGEAICPEKGKIGKIMFSDGGALSSKLNELVNENK